jgi:hypothetical protein
LKRARKNYEISFPPESDMQSYNFRISTIKTKVMAFVGKNTVRSKIVINEKIPEQVAHFKYLGCNVIYKYDNDIKEKLHRTLKTKHERIKN